MGTFLSGFTSMGWAGLSRSFAALKRHPGCGKILKSCFHHAGSFGKKS